MLQPVAVSIIMAEVGQRRGPPLPSPTDRSAMDRVEADKRRAAAKPTLDVEKTVVKFKVSTLAFDNVWQHFMMCQPECLSTFSPVSADRRPPWAQRSVGTYDVNCASMLRCMLPPHSRMGITVVHHVACADQDLHLLPPAIRLPLRRPLPVCPRSLGDARGYGRRHAIP